jgi:purine-binding chemotaxis protein CheW
MAAAIATTQNHTGTGSASEAQFVSLGIGAEVFAVPVTAVLEILDMRPAFRIPEAPAHMLGLIDLRGRSVPVIDLRGKLGLPPVPPTESTRILVLEVDLGDRRVVLGLVADRVIEVMGLASSDIEPPPDVGTRWRSDYIAGIGHVGSNFAVIFDLPKFFSNEDTSIIHNNPSQSVL